jgi:hypothetical protein
MGCCWIVTNREKKENILPYSSGQIIANNRCNCFSRNTLAGFNQQGKNLPAVE